MKDDFSKAPSGVMTIKKFVTRQLQSIKKLPILKFRDRQTVHWCVSNKVSQVKDPMNHESTHLFWDGKTLQEVILEKFKPTPKLN